MLYKTFISYRYLFSYLYWRHNENYSFEGDETNTTTGLVRVYRESKYINA